MKRIEMIHLMADHIRESVRKGENLSISAEMLLEKMEEAGMFYCPVEDYGDFKLRTPKRFEEE